MVPTVHPALPLVGLLSGITLPDTLITLRDIRLSRMAQQSIGLLGLSIHY